jgi:serine/threonine-protein kinase
VCRTYDIVDADGEHFITMEYVDGEDLSSLLRRIGRLPQDKAIEISRQLCAGLAAAHDKGVLHRDLKPANVMLDGRGRVRITDFGIAALAEELHGKDVRSGTPAYMAPEQLKDGTASVRSDIYSLGMVMYELFTGREAFHAESLAQLENLRKTGSPATPSTIVRDIDPLVERVIMRCLEVDPRDRPTSAIAVAAALPGGDPLAMALAAGETPSPEMVAQAGEFGALKPGWAVAGLALTLPRRVWKHLPGRPDESEHFESHQCYHCRQWDRGNVARDECRKRNWYSRFLGLR